MNSFGSLWRVKTSKHIRSMNSIAMTTGPVLATLDEARRRREFSRLGVRRWLYAQRQTSRAVVVWNQRRPSNA